MLRSPGLVLYLRRRTPGRRPGAAGRPPGSAAGGSCAPSYSSPGRSGAWCCCPAGLRCSHWHMHTHRSASGHWRDLNTIGLSGDPAASGFLAVDYACVKPALVYQVLSGRWPRRVPEGLCEDGIGNKAILFQVTSYAC